MILEGRAGAEVGMVVINYRLSISGFGWVHPQLQLEALACYRYG